MKKIIIPIIALITAVCVAVGITYAWFNVHDIANDFRFQIAKIDSTVTLYKGIDFNFNGVPDLAKPQKVAGDEGYNADDRFYDSEYDFQFVGTETAMSDLTSASIHYSTTVENTLPMMINTFKIVLENKGDVDNLIALSYNNYSDDDTSVAAGEFNSENIKLLSCLSVTVGGRLGDDGKLTDVGTNGVKKAYFQDFITIQDGSYKWNNALVLGESDGMIIDGVLTSSNNVEQLWIQYTIESYALLSSIVDAEGNSTCKLTSDEYQALQGKSIVLPAMYVSFQVNSETL